MSMESMSKCVVIDLLLHFAIHPKNKLFILIYFNFI